MTHPHYDSEKKRRYERFYATIVIPIVLILMFGVIIFTLFKIATWENANKIPVWVEYEVKILDNPNQVVLYKSHDIQDSMVFRIPGEQNPFKGIEAIEKLEFRLP